MYPGREVNKYCLRENERDITSRWVHRESNLMFTLSNDKVQRQKSLWRIVSAPLPCSTKDVGELVVEQGALPHAVHYGVDGEESSD